MDRLKQAKQQRLRTIAAVPARTDRVRRMPGFAGHAMSNSPYLSKAEGPRYAAEGPVSAVRTRPKSILKPVPQSASWLGAKFRFQLRGVFE